MDRPLIIGNIHNLSLESYGDEQPQLVALFPCKTIKGYDCPYPSYSFIGIKEKYAFCCTTIWLHDSSMLKVKQLTLETPKFIGFYLQEVVNVTIELVEVYPIAETIIKVYCAIAFSNSHFIEIHSFIAKNMTNGVSFFQASNIHINNITTSYNHEDGIYSLMSSHLHISNLYFANNLNAGISIDVGNTIFINNVTSIANKKEIDLYSVKNAQVINRIYHTTVRE